MAEEDDLNALVDDASGEAHQDDAAGSVHTHQREEEEEDDDDSELSNNVSRSYFHATTKNDVR